MEFYDGKPWRWTQGTYAQDAEGRDVQAKSPYAMCWCLLGACRKLGLQRDLLYGQDMSSVVEFNDAPSRTFEQIQAKLKEWASE